jgi:hypothetical protein
MARATVAQDHSLLNVDRIDVPRFARILRQRLEARHKTGTAVRRLLDKMDDAEVVEAYVSHGRAHARRHAAEDEARRRHRTQVTVLK